MFCRKCNSCFDFIIFPFMLAKVSFLYWHFVDVMWFCVFLLIYFV